MSSAQELLLARYRRLTESLRESLYDEAAAAELGEVVDPLSRLTVTESRALGPGRSGVSTR